MSPGWTGRTSWALSWEGSPGVSCPTPTPLPQAKAVSQRRRQGVFVRDSEGSDSVPLLRDTSCLRKPSALPSISPWRRMGSRWVWGRERKKRGYPQLVLYIQPGWRLGLIAPRLLLSYPPSLQVLKQLSIHHPDAITHVNVSY